MPTEIYLAIAPVIAKSFTVPQTANLPILPPAKNKGFTTYESVVNAILFVLKSNLAPSCISLNIGLSNAGNKIFSISS